MARALGIPRTRHPDVRAARLIKDQSQSTRCTRLVSQSRILIVYVFLCLPESVIGLCEEAKKSALLQQLKVVVSTLLSANLDRAHTYYLDMFVKFIKEYNSYSVEYI